MKKSGQVISEDLKFDRRLVETNIRDGFVDKKDYEKHLKSLPDSASNVDYVEVFEEETEDTSVDENDLTFT